jgi:hypothetical protein
MDPKFLRNQVLSASLGCILPCFAAFTGLPVQFATCIWQRVSAGFQRMACLTPASCAPPILLMSCSCAAVREEAQREGRQRVLGYLDGVTKPSCNESKQSFQFREPISTRSCLARYEACLLRHKIDVNQRAQQPLALISLAHHLWPPYCGGPPICAGCIMPMGGPIMAMFGGGIPGRHPGGGAMPGGGISAGRRPHWMYQAIDMSNWQLNANLQIAGPAQKVCLRLVQCSGRPRTPEVSRIRVQ